MSLPQSLYLSTEISIYEAVTIKMALLKIVNMEKLYERIIRRITVKISS